MDRHQMTLKTIESYKILIKKHVKTSQDNKQHKS